MIDKYKQSEDILMYLRNNHTGAENFATSAKIERVFGIRNRAVRQIINKLRCDGQPICSDVNGYFYAKNQDEVNDTITQLLSRTKQISHAAQGLVLSQQIFFDGGVGGEH
jgi:biotin operon repressor